MFTVTDLFELHFIGPFWFLRSKLFGHFGGIKGKKVSQRDKVNLEALFEIYRYRSCEPSPLVVRGEPERKGGHSCTMQVPRPFYFFIYWIMDMNIQI